MQQNMSSPGGRLAFILLLLNYVHRACCFSHSTCFVPNRKEKKFHLLRRCQRSTEYIVGLGNFEYSSECESMVHASRGLAFNFSPPGRGKINLFKVNEKSGNGTLFPRKYARRHVLDQPEEFYNCIAFQCPENSNFTSMVNDSRFDYYSLYSDPPPKNSTCLNEVGVFQIYVNLTNYSTAASTCISKGRGALAHIVSEVRTHAISNFLKSFYRSNRHVKLAYVGLHFSKNDRADEYMTSDYEGLECFLYRAWAPGHPSGKSNESCVAITTENSWITIDCRRKLPFICELYTSGPKQFNNITHCNCEVNYN